jgi:hypothetical protein
MTSIAFALACSSCQDNKPIDDQISDDSLKVNTKVTPVNTASTTIVDTTSKFTVDGYSFTDDMFDGNPNGIEIRQGDLTSKDEYWFTNEELKQTIVVELYTDNFRMTEFHFENNSVPKHLIEKIGLHTDAGEMATQQQIEKYFHRFIDHATEANKKYFTTRKGLKLGDSREKILSMYGTPDSKIRQNNMEILEWHFTGDILYDGKTDLKGKPLAKDSYGHHAMMFFRNRKLTAIIFTNDIP